MPEHMFLIEGAAMTDWLDSIQDLRRSRYRQVAERQLHTIQDALEFVNEAGFCLFYPHARLELPNLLHAIAGDHDTQEGHGWSWKDELAGQKKVFLGKPFHHKPGFVALRMLAPLYVLTPAGEVGGDHHELSLTGTLTAEAFRITETLLERGSMSTHTLRQAALMGGTKENYRFSRALAEAQEKCLIAVVRPTSDTRAGYSYIWDAFERVWPDAVADAEHLSYKAAVETAIAQYVHTVVAATADTIAVTFALERQRVERTTESLAAQGLVKCITYGGKSFWVSSDAPSR
jgi:hypothetical protein